MKVPSLDKCECAPWVIIWQGDTARYVREKNIFAEGGLLIDSQTVLSAQCQSGILTSVVKLLSGCHFAVRISRNIPSRTSYKNAAKPLSREIVTRQWCVVKTAVSSWKNFNVLSIEAEAE